MEGRTGSTIRLKTVHGWAGPHLPKKYQRMPFGREQRNVAGVGHIEIINPPTVEEIAVSLALNCSQKTRLQGLKHRLAAADSEDAEELQQEIEELEACIEEITSFESGQAFHTRSGGES